MKQLATGAACFVGCLIVVVADHGHRWSWPLLGWGLLVGLIGIVGTLAVGRRAGVDAARWDAYPSFILLAVGLAVLAAGLDSSWPAVVFAAYVGIANFAIPIALLPRLTARAADDAAGHACASAGVCGAAACASCPLASQQQEIKSA